jgi:ketosteroid isomerase-like protein
MICRRLARLLPALLIMLLTGGLAAAAEKGEAGLMAADRAFAEAAAKDRLDGWMRFFADDAVKFVFKGPLARGKAAVREVDAATFANPAVSLAWDPTDAGLFRDGGTGFTRGDYRVLRSDDTGQETVLSTGTYLTIWRLEDQGWKVILDTGVPDANGHDEADDNGDHDHGDH